MSNHYEDIATTVVEGFKASIDDKARNQITPAQFKELANSLQKALSVEKLKVLNQIEQMLKKLRTEVDRPEIEL